MLLLSAAREGYLESKKHLQFQTYKYSHVPSEFEGRRKKGEGSVIETLPHLEKYLESNFKHQGCHKYSHDLS